MNKKALIWIIVAVVAVVAIVWIIVAAVNSGNNGGQNGGGGTGLNESTEITDTSVEGDRIEGSSLIVTNIEKTSRLGAKVTVVNAGDTLQNHMVDATFYDASGNEIASGSFTVASIEPGETKEVTMLGASDWENYDSVKYKVSEPSSTPGQ